MPSTTMPAKIPQTPDAITPDWLTPALREGGIIAEARATALSATGLGGGSGFTGQLARLAIGYDRDDPSLPPSLIAKMPGTHPETRRLTKAFQIYPREIAFYRQVGPAAGVRTPRYYYS